MQATETTKKDKVNFKQLKSQQRSLIQRVLLSGARGGGGGHPNPKIMGGGPKKSAPPPYLRV